MIVCIYIKRDTYHTYVPSTSLDRCRSDLSVFHHVSKDSFGATFCSFCSRDSLDDVLNLRRSRARTSGRPKRWHVQREILVRISFGLLSHFFFFLLFREIKRNKIKHTQ